MPFSLLTPEAPPAAPSISFPGIPTSVAGTVRPLITTPPRFNAEFIFRRQSPDFRRCGYINGNKDSEIRCGSEYSCASQTGTFGCCNDVSCSSGVAITCVDAYTNICKGFGAGACDRLGSVLSCPSACVTYLLRPSGQFVYSSYTSWSCGPSPTKIIVLATTTNPLPADGAPTSGNNGAKGATGGAAGGGESPGAPGAAPTTPSNPSDPSPGGGGGPSLTGGALAAVIVAALAVVLILGTLISCYCYRERRRQREIEAANRQRQLVFDDRGGAGASERMMFSDGGHGHATAQWVMNGYDDRQTVVG